MPVEAAQLIKDDQDHLIHPLHHPSDHLEPMVYVRGRGAMLTDMQGREYIDGLAGLWNVNVGHGRTELADAAADQIRELAYYSAYSGSTNIPAIQLASKLMTIAYPNMQGGVLHLGRRRVQRVRLQDRALLLEDQGQARQGEDHRALHRLPRRDAAGDERHRHGGLLEDVRAAGARASCTSRPAIRTVRRAPSRARRAGQTAARLLEEAILREGPDTVAAFIAEPIHGGGGVLYPTDDYFPLVRQGLRQAQRALHRRRGHHRLLPDRQVVRAGALERAARHRLLRQGRVLRLSPARRHHGLQGDQAGHGRGEAGGQVDARLHLLGAPDLLRGRASRTSRSWSASGSGSARRPWARACTRGCSRRSATTSTWATSAAARGCSPRSSWWRIAGPRRRSAPTRRWGRACWPR